MLVYARMYPCLFEYKNNICNHFLLSQTRIGHIRLVGFLTPNTLPSPSGCPPSPSREGQGVSGPDLSVKEEAVGEG